MLDLALGTRRIYSSLGFTLKKNRETFFGATPFPPASEFFKEYLQDSLSLLEQLYQDPEWEESIIKVAINIINRIKSGKKILCCGAGGSLHDHLVAELVNRFTTDREYPFPVIDLSGSVCTTSAIANDYGYEYTFSKQVVGLGNEGDLLIGFSTSAKTEAVLRAIKVAHAMRMDTILFTGAIDFVPQIEAEVYVEPDIYVKMKSMVTGKIQEQTLVTIHAICSYIDLVLTDKKER